jgi:hypothetical protein
MFTTIMVIMFVPMRIATRIGVVKIDKIPVIYFAIMLHDAHTGSPCQKSEQTNNGQYVVYEFHLLSFYKITKTFHK